MFGVGDINDGECIGGALGQVDLGVIAREGEAVHVAAGGEIASHAFVGANLVEADAVVATVNAEVEVAIGLAQQVARPADLVAPG